MSEHAAPPSSKDWPPRALAQPSSKDRPPRALAHCAGSPPLQLKTQPQATATMSNYDYDVKEIIGKGSFGDVFLAYKRGEYPRQPYVLKR